jgi:hypothetical protein
MAMLARLAREEALQAKRSGLVAADDAREGQLEIPYRHEPATPTHIHQQTVIWGALSSDFVRNTGEFVRNAECGQRVTLGHHVPIGVNFCYIRHRDIPLDGPGTPRRAASFSTDASQLTTSPDTEMEPPAAAGGTDADTRRPLQRVQGHTDADL